MNLLLKTECDARTWIEWVGVRIAKQKGLEYTCKVSNEEQANKLLATLVAQHIPVVTFDLREPSLHEIFVEKVGEADA